VGAGEPRSLRPGRRRRKLAAKRNPAFSTTEKQTPFKDATHYNNYYEFGTDKGDPAENAHTLRTRPWTVQIEGEVKKPLTLDIDSLTKLAPLEERVYRLRCVEGWSMVIPWVGYSLSNLIKPGRADRQRQIRRIHHPGRQAPDAGRAQPRARLAVCGRPAHGRSHASAGPAHRRHVRPGAAEPERRAGAHRRALEVRLQVGQVDRAHPLREATSRAPPGTASPRPKYGFYSNVNPNVDHPRWSQASERRIGEGRLLHAQAQDPDVQRLPEVASLYAGMDLKKYF
jgi:sulfoxide reductase catalytic subunit YedY